MRIMLTVVTAHGRRDVLAEGDELTTVAGLADALAGAPADLSNVVRLTRARAPYGLAPDAAPAGRSPSGRRLWLDGKPLDPDATVSGLLRDGDVVALDPGAAAATVTEEPVGIVEIRVVGGPAAGSVHRLGLGVYTIGSDPAGAIVVRDPAMPPTGAVVRVAPGGITVEPAPSLPGPHRHQALDRHHNPRDRRVRPSGGPARSGAPGRDGRVRERRRLFRRKRKPSAAEAEQWDDPAAPRLDGAPLTDPEAWGDGRLLRCGNSLLVCGPVEPPDAHLDTLPDGGLAYNRPPRLAPPERTRRLEVPAEPKRGEGMRLQLLAALLPAVFGLVMAFVFHLWYFLLIALMTPAIMIGQWWSDRRHGRKKHREAVRVYQRRLAEFEQDVATARAVDEAERRAASPDPAEALLTAKGPRRRLWERRIHDPDVLRLRLGLADLPADLEFVPERGSADVKLPDPPIARNVPVNLAMRRLGVAGLTGSRPVALAVARWLVGQAATLHSPRDLAVVVLSAKADGAQHWSWVRWLPHSDPRDSGCAALVGADPEAAARRVAELASLVAERLDEDGYYGRSSLGSGLSAGLNGRPGGWDDPQWSGAGKASSGPAFAAYSDQPYDVLLILDGAQVLRSLPGMPQVLRQGPRAGVYTLAIDDDRRLLPEECATVVSCFDDGHVRLHGGGLDALGRILADQVSTSWSEQLARSLAPLRDVSRGDAAAALPSSARLLDLLDLPVLSGRAIRAKWRGHTTRALIGVGPDGPYSVDLRRDGPHALIAGTTGAGKSELLQTLICALAAVNRPDEMTFVLIDYKGGAAFKECVRLPHTVGMVSDLDGHLTQRALESLAAELRRRERLLLAAGAKDIEDYQELRARSPLDPLPRLVLIIDEFAALVAELPDFVEGLVDIARRGRSLGIHLILATQRPQGVVTADIQANTSLRIALRVTDTTESADVIDGPEAARISKSLPGRCYVKSGAGAAVAVQTARIGGRAPGKEAQGAARVVDLPWQALGHPVRLAAAKSDDAAQTDLSLLVDALREAAREAGVPDQPSPWLPPLPDAVVLGELPAHHASRADGEVPPVPFGVTDLPWEQRRRPLVLDLAHGGHLLIAGTSRSGRSTALRTIAGSIAATASPADVHLHAVDCGSGSLLPLVALPHCGAVVTRDQIDRVERLLARLRAEVSRRQQILAEAGHASLAEARAAGHVERMPWLVFMLDRWEGFLAAFEQYDYGRLIEALMQLLREGPAVGLRAVVTADRSGLLGQISTVFDEKLVLKLADAADYGLAGLPAKNLPSSMPPGRVLSLAEHGLVESQVALLCPDPSGPAQVAELQALARVAAERTGDNPNSPIRVDALPMRITASQARGLVPSFRPPSPLWALLGVGGDALAPLGIDLLTGGPGAAVAGPARSGRSSALVTAARSLLSQDTPVLIVTPRRSPLRDLADAPGVLAVLDGNGRPLDGSPETPLPALLAGHPRYVVVVDDAELLSPDSPTGAALEDVLRTGRDEEHGLLIAGTTGDMTTAYRGFVAETRKSRTGLLLSVQSPADGDLFSVRLPRGAVGGPPGRGLLIVSGAATPLQTAVPD
ncbi:FtsK/SpoIIIE domain-containing protein [Thermopolyspora sp. NPDC052614]|uniref:FtsK/SpoIIIE domain-containing protein n=1 Tax=Thermopolyspora sp. NPDC052614 TaxID=3155682 RepID=UPI00342D92EC